METGMIKTTHIHLALLSLLAWYLYVCVKQWRFKKYGHIPHAFPNTLAFGHIKLVAGGYREFGDTRRHIDYVFEKLFESVGRPEFMFVDLRPTMRGMIVVASHGIAEQLSRSTRMFPYSVTKSPTMSGIEQLIGKKSLITAEGEFWKGLRRRFNPGFAHNHLLSLLPQILQKTSIFIEKVDALAESGAEFEMDTPCTNLTFDIIGTVVTDLDFGAQSDSGGIDIVRQYHALSTTYTNTGRLPLWLNIPAIVRRRILSYKADIAIKRCITDKFHEMKKVQTDETRHKDRSVLALALKDTDVLTDDILQTTADQVKSFLFAGHDTTSILLQRLFYALSVHPKCLAAIRAEHDAVFGTSDPQEVFLSRPDETFKALSYTSACIKEALRLWPPAATARMAKPGTGFKLRLESGEEICVDDTVLYNCEYLIQRDPQVYGETANDFVPARWLGDGGASVEKKDEAGNQTGASNIPISAWRPFERGPRNCIGQELANVEARVILACVMRRYDFIKVGAGEVELDKKGRPVLDANGAYKTRSEMFNSMVVTSKPFDKCRMRIKKHQRGI